MWYNAIVKKILKSPIHWMMSKNTIILGYQGRKTGNVYETPINYTKIDGVLIGVTKPEKTWWKNFIQPQTVKVVFQGKIIPAEAVVLLEEDLTLIMFRKLLTIQPAYARYYKVRADSKKETLLQAIQSLILLQINPQVNDVPNKLQV